MRTTIVLALLAAALLGFILIFERGTLTSRELERRKGDVVPELVRDRLRKIELQRKGVVTVLERGPDPEAGVELGAWQVVEPYRANADEEAVDELVGELEWMATRRRLEAVSDEDRKRFGFDTPRYRVWLGVGRGRFGVTVGNATPQGDGVYVQGTNPALAFVVEESLLATLNHEPEHYHTKALHDGLSSATAQALRLRDETGERALVRREGVWWLEQPLAAQAAEVEVDALVDALDRLRARRYLAPRVEDPRRYGLHAPYFEADVTSKRFVEAPKLPPGAPPEKPRSEEVVVRIRVGGACEGHAGERYVQVDGGALSCIADEDLAPVRKPVEALIAHDAGAADAAAPVPTSAPDGAARALDPRGASP